MFGSRILLQLLLKYVWFHAPDLLRYNLRPQHVHVQCLHEDVIEQLGDDADALVEIRRCSVLLNEDVLPEFDIASWKNEVWIRVHFPSQFFEDDWVADRGGVRVLEEALEERHL